MLKRWDRIVKPVRDSAKNNHPRWSEEKLSVAGSGEPNWDDYFLPSPLSFLMLQISVLQRFRSQIPLCPERFRIYRLGSQELPILCRARELGYEVTKIEAVQEAAAPSVESEPAPT
jgi:hypothetical protein